MLRPTSHVAKFGQRSVRKSAIWGVAALATGLIGSSAAWAQCTNTINGPFGGFSPADFYPLGQGGAVSAIVSSVNTANTAFLTNTSAFVSAPGGPKPDQQGGGAWGRAIGGSIESQTSSVLTPTSPILSVPGTPTG